MREILFRGKRFDNDEWVYGAYYGLCRVTNKAGDFGYAHLMRQSNDEPLYRVDPETVGEYTGLTDKNGKKIFEWDIVEQKDSLDYCSYGRGAIKYGTFNCGCCHAVYGFYATNEGVDLRTLQSEYDESKEIEVIGNIYDNPELLEEGE